MDKMKRHLVWWGAGILVAVAAIARGCCALREYRRGLPPATAELKPPKWILPLRLPGVLIPSSFRKGSSFVRARCWRKWIPACCRSSGWRRLRRLKRPKARLPPPVPCWSNARVKCAPRSRSSNSGKLSWTPSLNVTCVPVRCRSVARYLYNS